MDLVEWRVWANPNAIEGHALWFKGDVIVQHPEHGDQLYQSGYYAVTAQRAMAEELKRQAD
jgi:hypothetical protein